MKCIPICVNAEELQDLWASSQFSTSFSSLFPRPLFLCCACTYSSVTESAKLSHFCFFCVIFCHITWNSFLGKANQISPLFSDKMLNQCIWVITRVYFIVYMRLCAKCHGFFVLFFLTKLFLRH